MIRHRESIYIGESHRALLAGIRASGVYLDSAEVATWELFDSAGTSIADGTLEYVAESDGEFADDISGTTTDTLTEFADYDLVMILEQGGQRLKRTLYFTAMNRGEN